MSFRGEPETPQQRLAALEAQMRKTTQIAISGVGGVHGSPGPPGPPGSQGLPGSDADADDALLLLWLGGPT